MAITSTENSNILKLIASMFNLAPTSGIYNSIVSSYEATGNNLFTLAGNLAYSGIFNMGIDSESQANTLVSRLGITTGTSASDVAYNYFLSNLNKGIKIEAIAAEAISYLSNDSIRHSAFDDAAAVLTNKVTVAQALIDSGIVASSINA